MTIMLVRHCKNKERNKGKKMYMYVSIQEITALRIYINIKLLSINLLSLPSPLLGNHSKLADVMICATISTIMDVSTT